MEQYPLVTIILAVYNGEKYLAGAIESILKQTYQSMELIIIDGASYDGTVSIIKDYDRSIAFWVSEPDEGIYDAWNKGISKSSGTWIAFLGCDDLLLPDAIKDYIDAISLEKMDQVEFISSKVALVTENLEPIKIVGSAWKWKEFRIFMTTAHVGALHHKNLFRKYGLFNTNFKIAADYELLLRAKKVLNAGFLDKVTVEMRTGGASVANEAVFYETLIAKNKTGGRSLFFCTIEFLIAKLKNWIRKLRVYS